LQPTCESCGRDTDAGELIPVRRAYFFHADDPDPKIADDSERWCASCRHTYPHVEDTSPPGAGALPG
jgi:hypothetical protein